MTARKLCADAKDLALGAQRAAEAGDMEAFVELITSAASLLQIAKALQVDLRTARDYGEPGAIVVVPGEATGGTVETTMRPV